MCGLTVSLSCTEIPASTVEEDEAYSSEEDEATATPLSSTAALTALSGAISEADFAKAATADPRALQKPGARGDSSLARGDSSVAVDEQAESEAAASSSAVDAAGDAKKKRNRKQRYKDNLVPTPALHLSAFSIVLCLRISAGAHYHISQCCLFRP